MKRAFQQFLQELAQGLGYGTLLPDEYGGCAVTVESQELLFEFDDKLVPNTVLLSAAVCELPRERRKNVLLECLKANSEIEETLSKKPDEEVIYLHRRLHPDIRAEELKIVSTAFANRVAIWQKKILS